MGLHPGAAPRPPSRRDAEARLGTQEDWETCSFGPYNAGPYNGESWQKRTAFQLDDIPRQKGHPYSRKMIWYDKETMMPIAAFMYDRAGQPYKFVNGVWRWSEDSPIEDNHGRRVLNWSFISVVNVQNKNSHVGQFDNASTPYFSAADSRQYYDTTRLKRGIH